MSTTTERCPQCGASVPSSKQYVTWCECGWNLEPTFDTKREQRRYDYERAIYNGVRSRSGAIIARESGSAALLWLMTALITAFCVALLVGAVVLLSVHFIAARVVGVLLALGFLACVAPLFRIAKPRRSKVVPIRELPELAAYMQDLSRALKLPGVGKVVLYRYTYGMSVAKPALARRATLAIGLPLLTTLDADTFAAGLIRELVYVRHLQRCGFDWHSWADGVLAMLYSSMTVKHHHDPRLVRRANLYVYIGQLLMRPLAIIPYGLHKLMEGRFVLMMQLAMYRSNAEALRYISKQSLSNYLSVLGLRDPVLFELSRIPDSSSWQQQVDVVTRKRESLPEREIERYFRTSSEPWINRPRPYWQAQVLNEQDTTDTSTATWQQIHAANYPALVQELVTKGTSL